MYLAFHSSEHEVQPLVCDLIIDQVQVLEPFGEARSNLLEHRIIYHTTVQLYGVQVLEVSECLRQVLLVAGHKTHPEYLQGLAPEEQAHLGSGQIVLAQNQLHRVGHELE